MNQDADESHLRADDHGGGFGAPGDRLHQPSGAGRGTPDRLALTDVRMPRIFTVREAEATLPLVRRVVDDLLAAYPRWKEHRGPLRGAHRPAQADEGEPRSRCASPASRRPARRSGSTASCRSSSGSAASSRGSTPGWSTSTRSRKTGWSFSAGRWMKTRITHWHEVDAGFAGRQPIDSDHARRNGGLMTILAPRTHRGLHALGRRWRSPPCSSGFGAGGKIAPPRR